MKLLLLPLLLTITCPAGCIGQHARTQVLGPSIKAGATYAIKAASGSPTADPVKLASFRSAVDASNVQAIKVLWPGVYVAALDGIFRRADVAETVKPSLREPLIQLDQAIGRLR